ncbi:MAG: hypothetical protein HOY76_14425 [Streptomyces sp.]|nr:hypothetical protein [Streptomyces sp.]
MRRMHWSWEQLQQTPMYVRRYCVDFLAMLAEQQEREAASARRKQKRQQQMGGMP